MNNYLEEKRLVMAGNMSLVFLSSQSRLGFFLYKNKRSFSALFILTILIFAAYGKCQTKSFEQNNIPITVFSKLKRTITAYRLLFLRSNFVSKHNFLFVLRITV